MKSFDNELLLIHQQISIRDEDRRPYTRMFEDIRDWLMQEMCDEDPLFRKIFNGTALFGSYPNRVRIITPSEFDISVLLKFPFPIKIFPHPERPGFVEIESRCKHVFRSEFKDSLKEMFVERGIIGRYCLNRNRLQSWIKEIIETFIYDESRLPIGYEVKYKPCHVAHNIYVKETRSPYKRISIDFVPSIVLAKESVMRVINGSGFKSHHLETFVAIPKKLPGCGPKNSRVFSFQLVNPEAERDIIWDKQNLKIVYRLLKSLRNKLKLRRLKSYFLTAIFLHEVNHQPQQFWRNPVGDIFLHMLSELVDYFDDECLPFYWAPDFDVLEILRSDEITLYAKKLSDTYNRLRKLSLGMPVSYNVRSHFQTSN